MRRITLFSVLACVAVMVAATPANAVSIFLGDPTSPSHVETYAIDTTSASVGNTLGIWVVPDASQTLNGVDLNLRVDELGGNAIDFTGAVVHNPANASSQRWFADTTGTAVDSVTADLITGMIGATTTGTGAAGEGTGIDDTNSETDPGFDGPTSAYLFATVTYDIVGAGDSANLWLQISDAGVADTTGLDTAVLFGLADATLDASDLGDRNVDQQATGNDIADAAASGGVVDPCPGGIIGNYDCSALVSQSDLDLVLLNWGNPETPVPVGWINDLPTAPLIAQDDLDRVLLNWGNIQPGTASATASAVPEPSTIGLLLLGLAAFGLGRRTR